MKSPRIALVKDERSPVDHKARLNELRRNPPKAAPTPPPVPMPEAPTLAGLAAEVALLRQAVEGLVAMQRMGFAAPSEGAGDLLYGAPAIAAYLGIRERQCRARIDKGEIRSFRIGTTVCAGRSTLREWIAAKEAAR